MFFPSFFSCVAVTFTNVDWSGEHVNVQNKFTKFALHAGQLAISVSARFKFFASSSI
jgi:hypothetical protein